MRHRRPPSQERGAGGPISASSSCRCSTSSRPVARIRPGWPVYVAGRVPGPRRNSCCAPRRRTSTGEGWRPARGRSLPRPVDAPPQGSRRDRGLASAPPNLVLAGVRAGSTRGYGSFGHGSAMEVYKDVGPAIEVCTRYGISSMAGYQAIGHTRMATESAVTIEHSHPFAAGPDLALVHNGSFSNHASIRRDLPTEGVVFRHRQRLRGRRPVHRLPDVEGLGPRRRDAGRPQELRRVLHPGRGDRDSIAVVRDWFACKPMVVAETDDCVALASEYVALADLPGIEKADVFEPMPEELYTWPA